MKGKHKYEKSQSILMNLYNKIYILNEKKYSISELYAKYLKLLRQAAYLGYPEAQYDLAQHYEDVGFWGVNNPYYSPKKCVYWYTKACEQNFPDAFNNLATFYENGIGVEKNIEKALALYKRGGELGYKPAIGNYKKYIRQLREREERKPFIQFHPFKGLSDIQFSFTEEEIIKILGEPDKIKRKEFRRLNPIEHSIDLTYKQTKIKLFVLYVDNKFDQTTICTKDLILDGVQFSKLSKWNILKYIKTYHSIHNIPYKLIYKQNVTIKEEEYCFKNLGLKIWFERDIMLEIFICRKIEDDWL